MDPTVVVLGAAGPDDTPGLDAVPPGVTLRFVPDAGALPDALRGADAVFSWDYRGGMLEAGWEGAGQLRWVHWAGAGVDAALFPALVKSDVTLTNSAGIFDQPIAEFVLALVLAFAKQIPESLADQREHRWRHRLNEQIAGTTATVVGVGGIGHATTRLLRAAGMTVAPVGRHERHDPQLGMIHGVGDLAHLLPQTDVLIAAAPLTPSTRGMFDAAVFGSLPDRARFINVGRGALVDESALVAALRSGGLAGAGLDVFQTEPLPEEHALWDMPNVIITPHHAGDHRQHREALVSLFLDNLARFVADRPLRNVVDKRLGFVSRS